MARVPKIRITGGKNVDITINNADPNLKIIVKRTKGDVKINLNKKNEIGEALSGSNNIQPQIDTLEINKNRGKPK